MTKTNLARIVLPLLQAWSDIRLRVAELTQAAGSRWRGEDRHCRLLMSVPGVGTVTATAFAAAVEDPANFKNSRAVGAWVGLTPRRYQSGEVDYDGHISRRGDAQLRSLLYEAAAVILNRSVGYQHPAKLGVGAERTARLQASGRGPWRASWR